jgi:hypothetical protein
MPSPVTDRLAGSTASVAVKAPVLAVSTANVTLSGEQTVGGVAVVDGDRVLLRAQTDATENGIYVVSETTWTRAKDFDGARDVVHGTLIIALFDNGNGLFYQVVTENPITIGTTEIEIGAFSTGEYVFPLSEAEISESTAVANTGYPWGYVERLGGTVPNRRDIATETAVAGTTMRIERILEASTFPLEEEASIWSSEVIAHFAVSREFGAGEGGVGGPCAALFAFANNNGSDGDICAFIGDAVARVNGGTVFAGNLIARNGAGITGSKLVGLEIDIEPAPGTTVSGESNGIIFNVFSGDQDASVGLIGGVGGGTWANGFISSRIRGAHYAVQSGDPTTAVSFIDTTQGTFSTAAIKLGEGAAGGINFGGDTFSIAAYIYTNAGRDLILKAGATGFLVVEDPDGVDKIYFDTSVDGSIHINALKVLGPRDTGWAVMTGTPNEAATYDTASVTLPQLAGRVMALQTALTTHGLIGA